MAWNGTEYIRHYGGHSTDVVGFSYCTEEFCPRCTLGLMGTVATLPLTPARLESEIRIYGETIRDLIDPEDPRWRDSNVIPQPIFNGDDAYDNDDKPRTCAGCHDPLVD